MLAACASGSRQTGAISPVTISADVAGLVHAGETCSEEEYAMLDRLGADWLLATFYWSSVEPADDQWDFDSYDEYVDTAQAAGKKIIGVLGYDVRWIHKDNDTHRYIPPDKLPFFLDYVRQTAEHFRGRVDAWCVWNEPNFHNWNGTRYEFFELTRLAFDALKEADPDVTLLGGAFNRGVTGLPKAYIHGLFASGAMEKADAVAFHPYEMNPTRTVKLYRSFRAIAAGYGFADRIWITEVGYPTGGLYPTATTENRFPAYIVKTFVHLAAEGAQKVFWYQLFDPLRRNNNNSENFFGLVRSKSDYTSKGAEAFRLCAVYLAGAVYRPDLPTRDGLPNSLKTFYFERPGAEHVLVMWREGDTLRLTVQAGSGLTVHDPVSGNADAVPADAVLEIGTVPVFLTFGGIPSSLKIIKK